MPEKGPAAKVAIIGIPGAGKTTLFCALTGTDPARAAAHAGKVAGGAVRIEDPRLLAAHQKNGPEKKLVAPSLEFLDTPAIWLDGPEKQDNPGRFAQFRDADGFVIVLRAYEGEKVDSQLESIKGELFLADVDVMQKRIEKLRVELKKTLPGREESQRELGVLEHLAEAVAGGDAKAFDHIREEDEKKLRGFQFFSKKPIIPIANCSEMALGKPVITLAPSGVEVPAAALKLELELLAMEPDERASFMKDYGLATLATAEFPRLAFERMGFQTFLTLGDKDTTGWALRKGGTSWDAAGKIHTDIQKGFINAEVIAFADLEKAPSAHAARQKQRIEGRAYAMKDFDILNVKFNV